MRFDKVVFKDPHYGYCLGNLHIHNEKIDKIELIDNAPKDFRHCDFFVTPGFVNCHIHPNQLFDRGLLDQLSITELLHNMHGVHKKTDEARYVQAMFVLTDAIKSGATSFYAVANHPGSVIKAFKNLGIKGAISCFYNDQWEGHGDAPSLAKLQVIENKFIAIYQEKTDKIDIHIGSASVQSASSDLLMLLDSLAKRFNTFVNIHVSEGIESVDSCLRSRKVTPICHLDELGVLSSRWNLIHAVNINREEISLIANRGARVIHCPVSNAKTGVGIAPIKALMDAGVVIGLGTDACSNNNTNNILNEAYFAYLLHSVSHNDPKIINPDILMNWLITNGHTILGHDRKPYLEVGMEADVLFWSLKNNAFCPINHGHFEAMLFYNAPDVKPHTVLIDGRIVIENYQFVRIAEAELRDNANMQSTEIFETA